MTVIATATLDANSLGANGAEITMTIETLISLYLIGDTGDQINRRATLEYTADGTNWFADPHSLNGNGNILTNQVVATKARACICAVEGAASTVKVILIAR